MIGDDNGATDSDGESNESTTATHGFLSGGPGSRRRYLATAGSTGLGLTAGCVGGLLGSGESITVGYQPFGTPYWSELVVKNGELIEKYVEDVDGDYDVSWQSALQGTVIGNRMISGENQAGYNGDMPTIIALANDDRPISMIGLSAWSMGQQCNVCITPTDSDIDGPEDLDGADVGITSGACSHRFLLSLEEYADIDANIVDQDVNTILANIEQGELDAGIMWEPNPTMAVVQQESADWVVTGAAYDDPDIGALTMNDDFIEDHHEAAKAVMKAELEAKHIMKTDQERTVDLIKEEADLDEYERATVEAALFESIPTTDDVQKTNFATDLRAIEPARELLQETAPEFLLEQETIDQLPDDDRYHFDLLDEAADELEDEVDWDPRDEEVTAES